MIDKRLVQLHQRT